MDFMSLQVNHHFRKTNSYYHEIEHPRYGWIQSVTTSKPVKAGEELYTNYGYKMTKMGDEDSNFPWYWELKRNMDKEARLERRFNTRR